MSQRRGREWGPSDDELLQALDSLVEEQDIVEALQAEVELLQNRVETVDGQTAQERGGGEDRVDVDNIDAENAGEKQQSVPVPGRVFPC